VSTATTSTGRRISNRALLLAGLVISLLIAGVASFYASSHPDGLEHVAEQTGFASTQESSAAEASPLADYQTSGVENQRLSGGIAGVLGVGVVLLVGGGLFWVLRRRGRSGTELPSATRPEPGRETG
jgi:cobalt/nickel transport protein